MYLKKNKIKKPFKFFFEKSYRIYWICILCFLSGFQFHSTTFYENNFKPELLKIFAYSEIFKKYTFNKLNNDLENLYIHINFKNFQSLEHKRSLANVQKILKNDKNEYVTAIIESNEGKKQVNIRLKGDLNDHHSSEKPSYRVKVKNNDTLMGMSVFSLQGPGRRGFLKEWFFHKILMNENLIFLRYEYVNVYLNGKNLGLYAIEEHFDSKTLIENNKRKDAPIIKFNDEAYMDTFQKYQEWKSVDSYHDSDIDLFSKNRLTKDLTFFLNYQDANVKLENFRQNKKINIEKIFDIDQLSKYFAICDLLNTKHGLDWSDLRFYYNPITTLLEPIGFDASGNHSTEIHSYLIENDNSNNPFLNKLFKNIQFKEKYLFHLFNYEKKKNIDGYIKKYSNDLKHLKKILSYNLDKIKDIDLFYSEDYLDTRKQYLKSIKDINPYLSAHIYAKSEKQLAINFKNKQFLPIIVNGLYHKKNILVETNKYVSEKNKRLANNYESDKIIFDLNSAVEKNFSIHDLYIGYNILGLNKDQFKKINPWSNSIDMDQGILNIVYEENVYDQEGFIVNEKLKEIKLSKDKYFIKKNLIFPTGYKVIISADTQIILSDNANFISFSPIFLLGKVGKPISFKGINNTQSGIIVLKTDKPSIIKHTIFENLSNSILPSKNNSGAITFYESDVEIKNTSFNGNKTEDYLNIIRSKFSISHSVFKNIYSDAIDSDFSFGSISNVTFEEIGNDAIDLSNTNIYIANIDAINIGDKGISLGEKSTLEGHNIFIENAELGIACKDLSEASIENLVIKDSNIGLSCFQKKPEFGPAKMNIINGKLKNLKYESIVESKSKLSFNDKLINDGSSLIHLVKK